MTKKKNVLCCMVLFFTAFSLSVEAQNYNRRLVASLSPNPSISGIPIKFNVHGSSSDMFVLNIRNSNESKAEILFSHTVFGGMNILPYLKPGDYYFVLIKVGDPMGTIAGRGIITVRSSDYFQGLKVPN